MPLFPLALRVWTVALSFGMASGVLGAPGACAQVTEVDTPVKIPLVIAGTSGTGIPQVDGYEAIGAVVQDGGCRPHFLARATDQRTYWNVPLPPPASSASFGQALATAPFARDPSYITGQDTSPPANVDVAGNDNMVVPLHDGSVLVAMGGPTWNDNLGRHPGWWGHDYPDANSATSIRVGQAAGQRAFLAFWHVQCHVEGGRERLSWTNTGIIDAATLPGRDAGQGAHPGGYCALNPSGIGGWDRPEMYVDPFRPSRVYLELRCTLLNKKDVARDDTDTVYISDDLGQNWRLGMALPTAQFHSMATTTHGGSRLWALAGTTLQRSDDEGMTLATPLDITVNQHPAAGGSIDELGVRTQSPSSLSWLGEGALLAAYPFREGTRYSYELAVIKDANTSSPHLQPFPGGPIRAVSAGGSVFDLVLLPDYGFDGLGLVVAYWLETDGLTRGGQTMHLRARYAVFSLSSSSPVASGNLSGPWSHPPATKASPGVFYGDYFRGATYRDADWNVLSAAMVWPEEDAAGTPRLVVRTISLKNVPALGGDGSVGTGGTHSVLTCQQMKVWLAQNLHDPSISSNRALYERQCLHLQPGSPN